MDVQKIAKWEELYDNAWIKIRVNQGFVKGGVNLF